MVVTVRKIIACLLLLVSSVAFSDPININTADAETLATVLVGVGPSKAQAIIQYRETHGPFGSVQELASVKGIGEKTVERNREKLLVADQQR